MFYFCLNSFQIQWKVFILLDDEINFVWDVYQILSKLDIEKLDSELLTPPSKAENINGK